MHLEDGLSLDGVAYPLLLRPGMSKISGWILGVFANQRNRISRIGASLLAFLFAAGCQHPSADNMRTTLPADKTLILPASASEVEYNAFRAYETCLDVIAHNIANANTTAYKRCRVEFEESALTGGRWNVVSLSGVSAKPGSEIIRIRRVFGKGSFTQTGERLDLAIGGDGFFCVRLPDGLNAFTRDGALQIASDGKITTRGGLPLLNGFMPVPTGCFSIEISSSGCVVCKSSDGTQSYQVQLSRFPKASELEAIGGNLFKETEASGSAEMGKPGENGFGSVMQGCLENSNVDLNEEMFEMARVRKACRALIEVAKARQW